MSDHNPINPNNIPEDKLIEVYLNFEGGSVGPIFVEPLADDLYRIRDLFLFLEFNYGSTVRAKRLDPETIEVIELVDEGEWESDVFVLHQEIIEKDELKALLKQWESRGIVWEVCMGGVLMLAHPSSVAFDPKPELDSLFLEYKDDGDGESKPSET